jgi:hypothetical protein
MSAIQEIALPDGTTIWARVGGQTQARDIGIGKQVPRVAEFGAREIAKLADVVTHTIRAGLTDCGASEISVDFGIELSVTSGKVIGVLAEVGGTASIVVHLTWPGEANPGAADDQQ